MRPTRSRWLAVSSFVIGALWFATVAFAETRPHYGGVLRIQTQAALSSLPTEESTGLNGFGKQLLRLIYRGTECAGACKRSAGPFRVVEFVPGKKITLAANDDYAGGRPYLDGIEIVMARPPREQMVALQLGRVDVIDVPAESMRHASQEGVRLVASSPVELVAIVFGPATDARVREAVSLSIDRTAIFNVLLGRQGEPTGALLPNWLTGHGFLFDASQNVTRARQLAVESGRARPLALSYDVLDPLARAIAERIALDARGAGLVISATVNSANPDARLVRIPLSAENPRAALAAVAAALGGPEPQGRVTPEELYETERKLRDDLRVIPLLHLPIAYGVAPRVKGWAPERTGAWSLADVWMDDPTAKGRTP